MSIEISLKKPQPIPQEVADAPPESGDMAKELSELTQRSQEPFNGLEQMGNSLVEPEPVDQLLDPSSGTQMPREVGAELEDPNSSGLTSRAKRRMLMLKTALAQGANNV